MGNLSWENIKSALIYGLIVMLVAGLTYIVGLGDTSLIHLHDLINVLVMSGATVLISLLKNLLTTASGKFLGVIKVIQDNK